MDNENDVFIKMQEEAIKVIFDMRHEVDIKRMALLDALSDVFFFQKKLKNQIGEVIGLSRGISNDLNEIIASMKSIDNENVMSNFGDDKTPDFNSVNLRVQRFDENYKILSEELPTLVLWNCQYLDSP